MKLINEFNVGADPELFIINTKTNKPVSAIGIIPGEKGNPYTDDKMITGGGIEIDNVSAEYNIPVCYSKEEFINAMTSMQNYIDNFVKNINPDYGICYNSSMEFDDEQLDNPIAKLFGCSVDYNAYTQKENPKPEGDKTNIRSIGFHIHLGYNDKKSINFIKLIKYMDMYLAIPSVLFDQDVRRRTLYGKAGAFRKTSFGFEYRSLSGFMQQPKYYDFIWNGILKSIDAYNSKLELIDPDLVQKCVNNSDVNLAEELVKQYNLV